MLHYHCAQSHDEDHREYIVAAIAQAQSRILPAIPLSCTRVAPANAVPVGSGEKVSVKVTCCSRGPDVPFVVTDAFATVKAALTIWKYVRYD